MENLVGDDEEEFEVESVLKGQQIEWLEDWSNYLVRGFG